MRLWELISKNLKKRIAVDYTGNSEGSAEWGIKGTDGQK